MQRRKRKRIHAGFFSLWSLERSVAFAFSEESRHLAAATGTKGVNVRHNTKTLTWANTTISQRRNAFSKMHSTADFPVPRWCWALWRVSGKTGCLQGKRWSLENPGYQHNGLKLVQYSDFFNSILSLRSSRQIRDKVAIGSTEVEQHGPVERKGQEL